NRRNLWVTTNQGLTMIDQNRKTIRSYNLSDGLINYEYSDGASWYDPETSRLLVGGTVGVDIIRTEDLQFSSYFPPLAINQLYVGNVPVEPGDKSLFEGSINNQTSLRLKFSQNTFALDVVPLAYWGQERFRIAHRLTGLDTDWVINPPGLMISFSDLKPGAYTLDIRVSDENGTWSGKSRQLEITILKPVWLTSWAILGYVLLVLGAQLIILATYRRREARRKEAALQEFKKQKEEELQSYKLEFFTQLAHEFRTPLTLITAHTHALLEEGGGFSRNKQRLVKVLNNSIKLQKLVLEIIRFRKLEKGKEPLSIRSEKPVGLIRDVISDLDLLAQQRNIRCEIDAPDPEMIFNTDPDKFQRIFTNLISNAIKYNRENGWVKASVFRENGSLGVEIEDSGVGINPEHTGRVFEPFGITSGQGNWPGFRSTGLGLAVTRGLVELLNGTITFESRTNEGTRFVCRFPELSPSERGMLTLEPEAPDGIEPLEGVSEPVISDSSDPDAKKALVLLVDDDPEILEVLTEFLRDDYSLITASNGVEAYARILADKPDLLVSDIMMPEMDGIELCAKIRANVDTSHLPVILLTARAETEDRIEGLKAGADSYIPKPFHPEHLRVRLAQLLNLRIGILKRFGKLDDNPALIKEIPDPFLERLLRFIDENLDDETLSAEKLCDSLAISKSSLYNKTRSVLGSTPHGLINQRRLQKAATLLRSTMLTVSEIIDQTGFSSRTYFYDLFNQTFNCSPTDYRNCP
ncbi:MAG: hybrid sensor histidine kinase/response regulator transcription factor, partial [Bacteroidales bacterium]